MVQILILSNTIALALKKFTMLNEIFETNGERLNSHTTCCSVPLERKDSLNPASGDT